MGQVGRSAGFFTVQQTCPTCGGTGKIIDSPCRACHGTGVEEKTSRVTLTIPAGVDEGKRIVIPHQGNAGRNGAPSGDLIVVLHIRDHEYFERDGVCAIEWSSVIEEALPEQRIAIAISGTGDERTIKISFPDTFLPKMEEVKGKMEKEGMCFENSSL